MDVAVKRGERASTVLTAPKGFRALTIAFGGGPVGGSVDDVNYSGKRSVRVKLLVNPNVVKKGETGTAALPLDAARVEPLAGRARCAALLPRARSPRAPHVRLDDVIYATRTRGRGGPHARRLAGAGDVTTARDCRRVVPPATPPELRAVADRRARAARRAERQGRRLDAARWARAR